MLSVKSGSTDFLLGVVYRPPHAGNLKHIEDALVQFMSFYRDIIIMGDFNADQQKDTYDVRYLRNIFNSCNLDILNTSPTCHTVNANTDAHTKIDLMITKEEMVLNFGTIATPQISRHDLIFLTYKNNTRKYMPKIITYRDWKNLNKESLKIKFESINWNMIYEYKELKDKLNFFNQQIERLYEWAIPLKTVRVTKPPAPWMTDNIKTLQKTRDAYLRKYKKYRTEANRQAFKEIRNKLLNEIRKAKKAHIETKIGDLGVKQGWKFIKQLGIGKQNIQSCDVSELKLEELNSFFVKLGGTLTDNQRQQTILEITQQQKVGTLFEKFRFKSVTEKEVEEAVLSIKSKAAGVDNINITFIQTLLPALLPTLKEIFNTSLLNSNFPDVWKLSNVRPLPKIKKPVGYEHWRPINILPALSKGLEKIVARQVTEYMETYSLLDPLQSGFKKMHSTTTALLKITDDIMKAMDQKKLTILVLIDFHAAFNSVDFDILLTKLKYEFNYSDEVVAWFDSYLKGRKQRVKLDEENRSGWERVERSVPAGSVLGPLLFTQYIQSLSKIIPKQLKYHCFADDVQLYMHTETEQLNDSIDLLSKYLKEIQSWASSHALIINPQKTQVIIIGSKRLVNGRNINSVPRVTLNGTQIPYCTKVKNLGVIFDQYMAWDEQVKNICKKVNGAIHAMYRLRNFLDSRVKQTLIQSLIMPIFDYADVVQVGMSEELTGKLQKIMNTCIRYIFNLKKDCRVTPYYNKLEWLKVKQRREEHAAVYIFKIIHTQQPSYLTTCFTFLSQNHHFNTRSDNKLLIPQHKTNYYNHSFAVSVARFWNSLPSSVRNENKLGKFRTLCHCFLLDGMNDE